MGLARTQDPTSNTQHPTPNTDLSIVIVTWNTRDLLDKCLEALPAAVEGLSVETWVVDNASSDGTVEMVRQRYPEVKVIANEQNRGWAGGNNQALAQSEGRFLLLLNADTEPRPGSLATLVRFLEERRSAFELAQHFIVLATLQRDLRIEVRHGRRIGIGGARLFQRGRGAIRFAAQNLHAREQQRGVGARVLAVCEQQQLHCGAVVVAAAEGAAAPVAAPGARGAVVREAAAPRRVPGTRTCRGRPRP